MNNTASAIGCAASTDHLVPQKHEGGEHEVEADGAVAVASQKGHEKAEADDDHDAHMGIEHVVRRHCRIWKQQCMSNTRSWGEHSHSSDPTIHASSYDRPSAGLLRLAKENTDQHKHDE